MQNLNGALMILGDGNGQVPTPTVQARSLLIDASASLGINIQRSGGFTADSQDVVVQGSGNTSPTANPDTTYPVYVQTPSVQTIPPGTYTGNFKDAILVHNPNTLDGDEAFHERGVPYRIRDELSISPTKSIAEGGLATLTIEAGVTLKVLKAPGNDWGSAWARLTVSRRRTSGRPGSSPPAPPTNRSRLRPMRLPRRRATGQPFIGTADRRVET